MHFRAQPALKPHFPTAEVIVELLAYAIDNSKAEDLWSIVLYFAR